MLTPHHEQELAAMIQAGGPFELRGLGSKRALGQPPQGQPLSLSAFAGVTLYEPDELVLEAGAATALSDIERLLQHNRQCLAFEPPDYSQLLGSASSGTIGGVISCGLAGPARIRHGGARDHVLGIAGVSGRGEIFKAGGRVVKNVTGFDLSKLVTGAFGTLAALTRITLKVLPQPETQATLCLHGLSDEQAIKALRLSLQHCAEITGAAHVPGEQPQTLIRLAGFAPAVAQHGQQLQALLHSFGRIEWWDAAMTLPFWHSIRDGGMLQAAADDVIWRLSVPPAGAARVMHQIQQQLAIEQLAARYYYDWGGGLIWLAVPPAADAHAALIRQAMSINHPTPVGHATQTGHATVFRAPDAVRSGAGVFHPLPPALAQLNHRVKAAFDPAGKLNPQRMAWGAA